jgi:hypothetical protein
MISGGKNFDKLAAADRSLNVAFTGVDDPRAVLCVEGFAAAWKTWANPTFAVSRN